MIPIIYPKNITYTSKEKFFIERSLELLDVDAMDSYRTRVMNPKTILSELNYVLKRFESGKIRHFNPTVEFVKNEAMNLLKQENELKFSGFSKSYYIGVLGQTTRDNYTTTRALTKVILSDNFKYNNDLASKIESYISSHEPTNDIYNDCENINRLTGYLFTGLIDKGFSKEFLRRIILSSFLNNPKKTFEERFEIFNFLSNKHRNTYHVYFKANIPKLAFKNITKSPYVKMQMKAPDLNLAIRQNENPRAFFKEEGCFIGIKIKAHDSISSVKIAKHELYNLLDLIHLCFISEDLSVSDKNLVIEVNHEGKQVKYWYRNYENKLDGSFKGGKEVIQLLSKHFERIWDNKSIKYESKKKINSSVRYFRLSSDSQEVEHKFLNYWIGLEYLFSNTDDPQSTIERVKKYLPAIQANVYLKRVIRDFHASIIRLRATGITGFKEDSISYLLEESTYDEIWDKYHETLPLLAHRARKFRDIFFDAPDPKKTSKLILFLKKHEDGLGQHLTRIYRVRNEIVHEAAVNIRTDIYTLTSNLKHYLLISLDTILDGLANNYGIDDINSFLIYQESIYENIKKEKLDLKEIMTLSTYTDLID